MEPSTSKQKSDDDDWQNSEHHPCSSASFKRKDGLPESEFEPIKEKRNEAVYTSVSGQSTSGESQKSSDSKVKDAPRKVPSLEHWINLAQEEVEIVYTRTAVKTTTQQSPTQRGLTSTTSTNMIPTTTTDTSIPATTTIMMTSSTTHVVSRNTLMTTDSTSSLTTVMATSSETSTPSVLNMSLSIATNTIQNTTFHENEDASLSTNLLLSSSEPVSTSTQATATTSRDSSSDSTQTATNTGMSALYVLCMNVKWWSMSSFKMYILISLYVFHSNLSLYHPHTITQILQHQFSSNVANGLYFLS